MAKASGKAGGVSAFGAVVERLVGAGWSLTSLANATGLDRALLHNYRVGKRKGKPQAATLHRVARASGISLSELSEVVALSRDASSIGVPPYGTTGAPLIGRGNGDEERHQILERLTEVPLFAADLAAGPWLDDCKTFDVLNPARHDSVEGRASAMRVLDQGLFRVRISGDSMLPKFEPGTIVEFKVVPSGAALEPGRCYYIHLTDGRCTFKKLVAQTEHGYDLAALNEKRFPKVMRFAKQELARAAVAVGIHVPV